MIPFPDKKYNIIYLDPPWNFPGKLNVATNGKEISDHYPTMSNEDIINLPIKDISAKDSVILLWTTYAHLEVALKAMKQWGFSYKTVAFEWLKRTSTGKPVCGMGKWTCGGAIELCLLGRKGSLKRINKKVRKLIDAPRLRHSQKPDETRNRIVDLFGDLPRIELFARERFDGWDAWGNEV